jgi:hypothetical protein
MANVPNLTIKPAHTDIREIVKDPALWSKVQTYIDEAVKCRQKISHEKENLKALRDACHEEAKLHKKVFNCAVDAVYNNDYIQRLEGIDQQAAVIELLFDLGEQQGEPAAPEEKADEPKLRLA